VFGYDTDSVIVTMDDFPGRKDINEKLMATQTSMIFYTMGYELSAALRTAEQALPCDDSGRGSIVCGRTGKAADCAEHGRTLYEGCRLQKAAQ